MERVLSFLIGPQDSRLGGGDSFTDRLSCRHTVFILGVLAVALTTLQWLGQVPIACWCPAHFTHSHVEFTNKACWTHNTYYLPMSEHHIPKGPKGKQYISYYQWVALALLCQAILFYLPRPLWVVMSKKSGLSVATVTDACVQYQNAIEQENRDKIKNYMVRHLGRFLVELSRNQLITSKCKSLWYMFYGNYLISTYLVIKAIYIINVIGQILVMNNFLGTDYHMYGFNVMSKMFKGESWSTSERFPRVTLCDIQIRTMGNIHNYTIQCSLPLNLFNEKMYIIIWFWFAIVAIATICSFFEWIWLCVYMPTRVKYIYTRLIALSSLTPDDDIKTVDKFVRKFLHRDGLFLLNLVAKNSSDMIAAGIICGLYDHFKENVGLIERLNIRDQYRLKKKEIKKELTMQDCGTDTSADA